MILINPPRESFPPQGEERERFEGDLVARLRGSLLKELGFPSPPLSPFPPHPLLHLPIGAFFSVRVWGELRGCLGRFPDPHRPLIDLVHHFAPKVLSEDPRFPPVTPQEAPGVHLEVSLLYDFSPMSDPYAFTPGVHGILVLWGENRATLLPQVAQENLLDREGMLKALLRKLGRKEGEGFDQGSVFYRYRAYIIRTTLLPSEGREPE